MMEALIMVSLLFLQVSSQDYIPSGYMGCYRDSYRRTLGIRLDDSSTNSGDECKRRCTDNKYRYAGTENSRECFCGDNIRSGREISSGCNSPCPNKDTEKCGGDWRISIFDTWPCALSPCLNGATCKDSSAQKFSCFCKHGWEGTTCELVITTPEISTSSTYTNSTHHIDDLTTRPVSSTMFELINLTSTNSKLVTDDKNSIIIIIVVPSAVTASVLVIIVIVCIVKRRTSGHQKHQSFAYKGQGSVPNIYAICAIDAESHGSSNARSAPRLSTSNNIQKISSSTLDTCISDENSNSLKRRSQDCIDFKDSYDHLMGNKSLFVDKTYSHINEDERLRQSKEREEHQYMNCISSGRLLNEDTYNRLQPGAVTQDRMLQNEESEYDHSLTLKKNSKLCYHVENEYSRFQNAVEFDPENRIYENN